MPKVKEKSLHAALWRFTYKKDLPWNLCPYFWKLVWGFIIFIPNFIIQLPQLVYELFFGDAEDCNERRSLGSAWWIAIILASGYVYITWHWIKAMLGCYSYDHEWANGSFAIHTLAVIVAIYFLLKALYKNYKKKKRNKAETEVEKTPNIIGEFVKAKYHRYCPKLEWIKADGTIREKKEKN